MSDREIAPAIFEKMTETAMLDEIREELGILAALQPGKAEIEAGRTVSHDEVKQRSATWKSQ